MFVVNRMALFFLCSYLAAIPASRGTAQVTSDGAQIVQRWYGVLDAQDRKFRFYITLRGGEADWQGTLLSLDEGGREFGLSEIASDAGELKFKLAISKAEFRGTISDSEQAKSVQGKWQQAGQEFEMRLQSVDALPRENLAAYWTGKLDAVLQKLDVAFRELDSGELFFDSLTQNNGGFVATKKVDGDKVIFEVPSLKAKFTGKLTDDGTEIVGRWQQGIIPLSLTLTKTDPQTSGYRPPPRPQTPRGPFPYAIEEIRVTNPQAPEVELAGTLTLPNSASRLPAVILISGSGPQDRDETIVDHKPFWVIADHLSRQGIAVLRFDDRGVSKSTGDFATATTPDFASDVTALVAFLRQHPKIDADKIALCGHSEGGLVAPMVAAADPRLAAQILLAGPGVNGEKILISQARLIMQASGIAEQEIVKQAKMQQLMIDLAKQQPPLASDAFKAAAQEKLQGLMTAEELTTEQTQQLIEQSVTQLNTPWFRYFLTYEPTTALSKVTCPTLVLIGELDLQVDPTLNIPAIERVFQESQLSQYETHILPGLNHLFQTAKTGNVTEYAEIEETISPAALELLSTWLAKTLID